MNDKRASVFDDELDTSDFLPKSTKTFVDKKGLKDLAESKGFSNREPQPIQVKKQIKRRNLTGRNQQLNIRVTEEVFAKFYKVADDNHWTLGETLEKCLNAFNNTK